jgi:RHS repeat-associated protein
MTGINPDISNLNAANANAGGAAGNSMSYDYDGDHTRIKEVTINAQGTTTTVFVGPGYFERITNPDNSVEYRHYLPGLDGTAGVLTRRVETNTASPNLGQAINSTRYWYKDHLGSPVAEFDANATSAASANFTILGFDTWGMRRKNNASSANSFLQGLATGDLDSYTSPRGFTGHQHLDELGLIHMNGRIYDPLIGRFLQADPIIQEPYNGQNFNRYTYVLNNPLAYTDPTGYSFWTEVRRPVGAIAVTWLLGPGAYSFSGIFGAGTGIAGGLSIGGAYASTISSIAAGFAAGGIGGGNIQSALTGAFTAGLLDVVGAAYASGGINLTEKIVAHAIIGCVGAGINGGSCGQGALAGGFAAGAGAALDMEGWDNIATRAVVGGVAAQLGGGKFVNGAFTASFNYLLNDLSKHAKQRELYDLRIDAGANTGPNKEKFPDLAVLVRRKDGAEVASFDYSTDPNATKSHPSCQGSCPVTASDQYRFTVKMGFNNANLTGGVRELMLSIGTVKTVDENPNNHNLKSATHVWIHRSEWYTVGCHVVPNDQWSKFIGYFKAGDKGTITVKR